MIALLPCPFCGGEPSTRTYQTESLWSHNIVTKTVVSCDECDIQFDTEPGYEFEAPEAWNRRATAPATPEGWKLVPTYPDVNMLAAYCRQMNTGSQVLGEHNEAERYQVAAYIAMIAAAPTPRATASTTSASGNEQVAAEGVQPIREAIEPPAQGTET